MQNPEAVAGPADHRLALIHEMSAQNFDLIRFASYRTAMKLRFIQKKVSLHAVDIWNVIEAFREHGLNTLEPASELSVARLETLLCSLFHSLNKRVPPAQQVHVDACSGLLLNWLLAAYATVDNVGKIRVFSIKVALATLCAGKLMDKLRYIFSQVSDSNGLLMMWRFAEYLQEVLALPAAVYESPTFYYNDVLPATIFNPNAKITVNDFMDTMMSDPGPPALVWLPLLHRIATVENVVHAVVCDSCQKDNFTGFRYRCQKCPHYTLCQECFWKGRVSAPHALDHQVKEYSTFSPSKTIGHTLRKSFRCVPEKQKNNLPRFPDQPEKTLNLSHIVPPSPLPSHNGFPDGPFNPPFDMGSLDSRSTARSLDSGRDDEHRLIARYAAKLKQEARSNMQPRQPHQPQVQHRAMLSPDTMQGRVPSEACLGMDSTRAQRELISQLEAKNREIMREIARLRRQQEMEASGHGPENPALMSELRALRLRKDELETHLSTLQDSRRQLMVQLEGLMKMLKNHQSSPRSTPNSSPRSTKSPPLPLGSTPTTSQSVPIPGPHHGGMGGADSLAGVGGDVRSAFGGSNHSLGSNGNGTPGSVGRSLRNDLLVAADSVTNAMSTLVRELNSEPSVQQSETSVIRKPLDFEEDGEEEDESDGEWQQELQRRYEQDANFMAELRARHPSTSPGAPPGQPGQGIPQQQLPQKKSENVNNKNDVNKSNENIGTTNEVNESKSLETLEWEEAMKRWVNR
ncbi:Dystrobrevin [Carabus blaptoides fortunei]